MHVARRYHTCAFGRGFVSSMSAGDLRIGIALCSSSWSAASAASGSGDVGGDPRTVQEAFVCEKGGDPRTEHASLNDEIHLCREMPLPVLPIGRGGSQPKLRIPLPLLLLCLLRLMMKILMDYRSPVHRDGLPCPASFKREANPESSSLLDRILQQRYSIGILRDFHIGESSERLPQSQLDQVQIVPATLIPSELSAHQMAARSDGSLTQTRVDGHPISTVSLQDKVLLRKYSIPVSTDTLTTAAETSMVQSEQEKCKIRSEGSQRAEDIPRVDQTDISVLNSVTRDSTDSSVSKDSELPNAGEADPKRRRRIGIAGIKKEPKEDSESKSDLKIAKFQIPAWCQNTPLDTRDFSVVRECGVTDMVLLYITLVSDRAIPAGFLAEFLTLEHSLKLSSRRSINIAASLSDAEAERLLVLNKKQRDAQILNSSAASDQLVLAAELQPRKFRSKW